MTEFRENLLDRMIKIYGFENEIVINFCRLCEGWPSGKEIDDRLQRLCESHEKCPAIDESE